MSRNNKPVLVQHVQVVLRKVPRAIRGHVPGTSCKGHRNFAIKRTNQPGLERYFAGHYASSR